MPVPAPARRDVALLLTLVAGSTAVYFYRDVFAEPFRPVFALASMGFFLASASAIPLKTASWALLVALVLWLAQTSAPHHLGLWLACSAVGAALVLRAGGRAVQHYLPEAGDQDAARLRNHIRLQLILSVVSFLAVYVWDGLPHPAPPVARAGFLTISAVFFVRYLLLQSKHLGLSVVPLLPARGLILSQRWPVLALMILVGATAIPGRLIGPTGIGALLITSILLFVLAGLLFALALVRTGWPKPAVRRTSFIAGIGLAVALAAAAAELEGVTPRRFAVFGGMCMTFLVIAPFVKATTRLFDGAPRLRFVIPPRFFSVMIAPAVVVSGAWMSSAFRGFLAAVALLVSIYYLVLAARERRAGRIYLVASLGALLGSSVMRVDGAWEVFALAVGFVLYAIDSMQRALVGEVPSDS